MDPNDQTVALLTEIRDLQRESLDEYRRVTSHSVSLQERAVARQEELGAIYKRVLVAGAIVILPLIVLLVYLLRLMF